MIAGEYMVAYKRPESVLVVIHSVDAKVLVMQRKGVGREAFWQSMTGSLEPGELPEQAAQRELFEETGLTHSVQSCHLSTRFEIRQAALHRYAPGTRWNTEHLFQCLLPQPTEIRLAEDEHTAYEWLPKHEALERIWSSSNREAVMQLVGVRDDDIGFLQNS